MTAATSIMRVISATPHQDESCELCIELKLRAELARALLHSAESRKRRPIDLLADIIEKVLMDDLITAVLDTD